MADPVVLSHGRYRTPYRKKKRLALHACFQTPVLCDPLIDSVKFTPYAHANRCAACPFHDYTPQSLAVKLASLDIHPELANGHAQVLHGEHRPVLLTTLSTTTVAWPLDAQRPAPTLILGPRLICRLSWDGETSRGAQVAHGVVGTGVACANAAVLISIGSNVGDEFLRGKR